jgi:DNA transformation protein
MNPPLVDHCLELFAPLGAVRARRMFGGHGLYVDDLFVALIAFDRLYLKVDAATQPAFEAAGCEPFVYDGKGKPITMGYWTVPADAMESPALMQPWARQAIAAALRARAPKPSAAPRKARAVTSKAAPTRRRDKV